MLSRLVSRLKPYPRHPFDREYGVETSARVRWILLGAKVSEEDRAACLGYTGSQPSSVRHCIEAIPEVRGAHFIDLGCGKGRAMAIATEYPFASISGIEISPRVARTARANMARIARDYPARTPATVILGDATAPDLPTQGVVVLYLYHPFRHALIERLLGHIAEAVTRSPELRVYVIYCNPVEIEAMDGCPVLRRFHAARIAFEAAEAEASPFGSRFDSAVIFQSCGPGAPEPHPDAQRAVIVTTRDWAAHVQPA